MTTKKERLGQSIKHWKLAKRLTLSSIIISGAISVFAVAGFHNAVQRHEARQTIDCHRGQAAVRTFSYTGIGVEFSRHNDQFVVQRVLPGTPAAKKLVAGAILQSADGKTAHTSAQLAKLIRGKAGTSVQLEVTYPHTDETRQIDLTREVISIRR